MEANIIPIIAAATTAIVAATTAIIIFLFTPASKENAKREALHQLGTFCPPQWDSITIEMAEESLYQIYKHLQYASRGNSFIITRAAVWEMIEIVKRPDLLNNKNFITISNAYELYIWKTLIASALGSHNIIPLTIGSQKNYKRTLRNAIKHTVWVLDMYNKMHDEKKQIDLEYQKILNVFKNRIG